VRDKTIEVVAAITAGVKFRQRLSDEIDGSYTRERDGVTCTYRAEHGGDSGGTVVWNARVYVGNRFVGATGGQVLAPALSPADLERLSRRPGCRSA